MKVLLLYPEYPDTFWSFKHVLSFVRSKAAYPPLGLLTIAPMLPAEWDKKLIDMNITKLRDEDILEADIVFISAMIVQKESALAVIEKCKKLNKKIVAGGPLFMSYRNNFEHVDHLILGEGEAVLPVFLKDLKEGTAKHVYESKERPDISKTPLPMWSLIRLKDYATMSVQYSRGCPFDCEFCDVVVLNGRTPRVKTPEQMISELQSLYDAGWRGRPVFIVDDNFIGNKPNVMKMLSSLIEWQRQKKYPFSFLTQTSVNLADNPELMNAMRKANFSKVFVGIETPNTGSLKECGKKQNVDSDLMQAITTINNNGMQVMAGFIVGFDSDPKDIFDRQINFIQKSGIVVAMVGILTALPGTKLWNRLKKDNRILHDSSGDNVDSETNIVPLIGINELKTGHKKILLEIYSKKNYYKRIETLMKSYNPSVVQGFKFTDLYALVKVFLKIGIFSKEERTLFWKIILKTLFTKTRALPEVITSIIWGIHFHTIIKKI